MKDYQKEYQKEYKKNMTDEEKQKYKEAQNKYNRDNYNNMTNEEKQKYKKNIKTRMMNKNKNKEIIKNNIKKM